MRFNLREARVVPYCKFVGAVDAYVSIMPSLREVIGDKKAVDILLEHLTQARKELIAELDAVNKK